MNLSIKSIADKKWFVPIVVIVLIVIAASSLSTEKSRSSSTAEEKLAEICMAISGSEKVSVMISYEDIIEASTWQNNVDKKIAGVAVVCPNGEDPEVKLKIYEVAKSLFGIPMSRITVIESYLQS